MESTPQHVQPPTGGIGTLQPAAGVAATIVGVGLYWLCWRIGFVIAGPLIMGGLIGWAMRLARRATRDLPMPLLAAGLLLVGTLIAYFSVHIYGIPWTVNGQPYQPSVMNALRYFIADLPMLMVTGGGGYIAWTVCRLR